MANNERTNDRAGDRAIGIVPNDKPVTVAPRGRLIDARRIVERFFTDDNGKALVSARWVRDNMPYGFPLSHSRVAWYDNDVDRILKTAAAKRIAVKDVLLDDLEAVA